MTGSHMEFKLKHSKEVSLHNTTRKGGQSANRIHRLGIEKRDNYITYVSEKIVLYFMKNNNTKRVVESLLIVGPGELKKEIVACQLIKQYFMDAVYKTIDNLDQNRVEKVFKEFIFSDNAEKEHPIIAQIDEMIAKADIDRIVFGNMHVKDAHDNYLLKFVISSDNEKFEKYKRLELSTGCRAIFSQKLENYGTIGVKWFAECNV